MKLPIRRQPSDNNKNVSRGDVFDDVHREGDLLMDTFARELDRWPDFFPPSVSDIFRSVMPLADVEESEDAYIVDIELPGVKKDDVSVEVTGDHLIVKGERRERRRVGLLRQQTRSTGAFHFEVTLPSDVDADAVTATLDDGVLNVVVPKQESARPRKIAIQTGYPQRAISA